MRLLKLPDAHFKRVAYVGAESLLTIDTLNHLYITRLWNLAQDSEPVKLTPEQASWACLLFRPGGEQFLRTQGVWPEGEPLLAGAQPERIEGKLLVSELPELRAFSFTPDGAGILFRHAGLINGRCQTQFSLQDARGNRHELYEAEGTFGTSAAFSPDGRFVAMSNGTKFVAVWDAQRYREVCRLEQSECVNNLVFVAEECLIAAAGCSMQLWNVDEARLVSKFRTFPTFADALAVSHDLKLFAAGSRDGRVRVWDSATGRELNEYTWQAGSVQNLAFSPDGTTAAAAGISAVVVWDID